MSSSSFLLFSSFSSSTILSSRVSSDKQLSSPESVSYSKTALIPFAKTASSTLTTKSTASSDSPPLVLSSSSPSLSSLFQSNWPIARLIPFAEVLGRSPPAFFSFPSVSENESIESKFSMDRESPSILLALLVA